MELLASRTAAAARTARPSVATLAASGLERVIEAHGRDGEIADHWLIRLR